MENKKQNIETKGKKAAKGKSGKARPVNHPPLFKKNNIIVYNRKGEARGYLLLSFLIPFIIMWIIYAKFEVHPFGDKQILVTDLWHQYFPFFKEIQDKLQHFSSPLFSWRTGMGSNFVSLLSYYGMSPLNLLSVFFPLESSREVITLLLTVKIGCAGLFCAIFLKNTFNRNDFSITAFGIFYALCDYIMGYYWNVIWMDTVALLPLVVLGTIMLFREGKYKLYAISLALSLVSNFYIGMFTCIFTVMVFAALVIVECKGVKIGFISGISEKLNKKNPVSFPEGVGIKYILKRFGQIAGATAIGVGMGAAVLLPAFLALQLTNSANNTFPVIVEYYEEWLTMISSVIGFHAPTPKEGLPNFYCGMFAVILMGVYLRSKEIKIREKVITVIYLAFIIVSCNMNVLNYMWHGFHFTNMLPYRFAFLFSFILIASAYRAFSVMSKNICIYDILAMMVMTFLTAVAAYDNQEEKALTSSIIVCLIYAFVMFLYERKWLKPGLMSFLILLVGTVEMYENAYIGVDTVTVTDHVSYPKNYDDVTALARAAEDRNAQEDGDKLFRTELMTNYTINDPPLYGLRGVSQFSSTANVNVINFLQNLGIQASAAGNRYYYTQSTPVVNMFLNIKYLISHDSYSGDITYLEPMAESGKSSVFENEYFLPLGFAVKPEITGYSGNSVNQFENQAELFKKATGIEEDIYNEIAVKDVGHQGLNVSKIDYGQYKYQVDNNYTEGERYFKYNYMIPDNGPVYIVFDFNNVDTVKVKKNDLDVHSFSTSKYINTYPVGEFESGDIMTLNADLPEDGSGSGTVHVYQINDSVLKQGYEALNSGRLDITDYSDTSVTGTADVSEDSVMYTSIPHDGGWKVYVDGKETEIVPLKNALVCFPVSAGSHKIEMKYSPPGFVPGLVISIVSIAALAAWALIEKKLKNKAVSDKSADGGNNA